MGQEKTLQEEDMPKLRESDRAEKCYALFIDQLNRQKQQDKSSRSLEYILEGLAGKTVLLVTHQVDFLPAFDYVLLMSNGKILQAAPYHDLLTSSREFTDLVNAHKETAGSGRLVDVTSSQRHSSSCGREIKKTFTEKPFKALNGDQLIMQEERERGDTGLKPYLQYLNQKRGYIYFFLGSLSHLMFVICQILQNSWMASRVDDPQ
ncbi:hypothetical protein TSUD_278520, partial [Trifolium subterraneum]